MIGYLSLTIIKAELTRDPSYTGEQEPFVRVSLGDHKAQTQVCEDAGKYPAWEKLLEPPFPISNLADDLLFECYDQDKAKLTLIGDIRVKVGTFSYKEPKKKWLTLTFKGKDSVELLIEANYLV